MSTLENRRCLACALNAKWTRARFEYITKSNFFLFFFFFKLFNYISENPFLRPALRVKHNKIYDDDAEKSHRHERINIQVTYTVVELYIHNKNDTELYFICHQSISKYVFRSTSIQNAWDLTAASCPVRHKLYFHYIVL